MPSLTESDFSLSSTASEEAATQRTISGLNGASVAVPWSPTVQQPPSELVVAVNTVARAVSARIAVLQAEIDALRRALQPFKAMGVQPPDVFTGGGDDAVNELLAIARKLGGSNAG